MNGETKGNVHPLYTPTEQQPQSTSSPQQKRDLSMLLTLGKMSIEEDVIGFKVAMETLTNQQNTDALAAVSDLNGLAQVHQLRAEVIGRAVRTINGKPLDKLYQGSKNDLSETDKAIVVVGSWQQIVVNKFFDKYQEILERSQKAIEGPDLKN